MEIHIHSKINSNNNIDRLDEMVCVDCLVWHQIHRKSHQIQKIKSKRLWWVWVAHSAIHIMKALKLTVQNMIKHTKQSQQESIIYRLINWAYGVVKIYQDNSVHFFLAFVLSCSPLFDISAEHIFTLCTANYYLCLCLEVTTK